MKIYKYIIFLCFLCFSCEKNNGIDNQTDMSFCNSANFSENTLSVLSFNRLSGTSLNSVSNVIEAVSPDIIGLQEAYEMGIQIANRFDYCFYGDINNSAAILSKYPIDVINDVYCKIILNESIYVNFFNVHFSSDDYQPYDIRDMLITTPLQAIYQAEQTRGLEADFLLENINEARLDNNMPIIVAGDFNEPSHLDWITGAENPTSFAIDDIPFVVDWPTSNKMLNAEMKDAYRELYPDPIQNPGYTWTPEISLNEVHDRIDFIYYDGNGSISLNNIDVVGPDQYSDIVVNNYDSNHRGVFSVFSIDMSALQICEFCGSSSCCSYIGTHSCCCYSD